FWSDLEEVKNKAEIDKEFRPGIETTERNYRYNGWKKAVARAQEWEDRG
ncbi:hypothetical protein, partial [Escherichia coli]